MVGWVGKGSIVSVTEQPITIDLHGSKAQRGVELDGLQSFLRHFRAALRDYERSSSQREHEVGRGGHPDARARAVTRFRLIGFSTGSGIAVLDEVEEPDGELSLPVAGAATANLNAFLDAVQSGELDPGVIDSLDAARQALGRDGSFGVRVKGRERHIVVDAERVERLRGVAALEPQAHDVTVTGRLHLVEIEEPYRVEIRASDGVNWHCTYSDDLGAGVLALVGEVVLGSGVGRRLRGSRGSMELREIAPLPRHEQSPLFSYERVPERALEEDQGIHRPQGLAAVEGHEAPDDEGTRRFLAVMLEDSET
jgi:hypothetical protein